MNIINRATNKSIAVGKCFGIDFGEINRKKSSFFIKNKFLNSLDNYLGYEFPHYLRMCKESCYYYKLAIYGFKKFKRDVWGILKIYDAESSYDIIMEKIPTLH